MSNSLFHCPEEAQDFAYPYWLVSLGFLEAQYSRRILVAFECDLGALDVRVVATDMSALPQHRCAP